MILAASETEDSLVLAHNGDASVIVPTLRSALVGIIKGADTEDKKVYTKSLIQAIAEIGVDVTSDTKKSGKGGE